MLVVVEMVLAVVVVMVLAIVVVLMVMGVLMAVVVVLVLVDRDCIRQAMRGLPACKCPLRSYA